MSSAETSQILQFPTQPQLEGAIRTRFSLWQRDSGVLPLLPREVMGVSDLLYEKFLSMGRRAYGLNYAANWLLRSRLFVTDRPSNVIFAQHRFSQHLTPSEVRRFLNSGDWEPDPPSVA